MKRAWNYIALLIAFSGLSRAQLGGDAGAFARLGFGARGIGLGNAMTAVRTGEVSSYYNPALSAFSSERTGAATFGLLSFDRYLNFLSYTQSIRPTAGISVGLINAGVRRIDGRDADGFHTEDYSTTENQFYLSFSNRVVDQVSLGATIKLYYTKLFDKITSTTVGFDVGVAAKVTEQLTVGAAIQDLNSKYKWDTKPIYLDLNGKSYDDKFPTLRRIGLSYTLFDIGGLIALDFENSSAGTDIVRLGAEVPLAEYFTVRGGIDRWEVSGNPTGVKGTFGFSLRYSFASWTPAVTYAFVAEPYSPQGMHIITLSTTF
jgi:hypothetical protein